MGDGGSTLRLLLWERLVALLPLGRRCPVEPKARLRRDGPDEGAFIEVAPHQFGPMTYGRAIQVETMARSKHATVSHGLTSSPPRGEGVAERHIGNYANAA